MNKQRLLSIILVSILAVVTVFFCSCGVDTSTIASSASQINRDSESAEEDYEYDSSTEDIDAIAEDEEDTDDLNEEEQLENAVEDADEEADEEMVWVSRTGNFYHSKSSCSNMRDPGYMTISEAEKLGRKPCSKCY